MKVTFLKKHLPVFLSCLVLLWGYSFGQVITADVTGIVTDTENVPLPGATVTITMPATGFSRSVLTDSDGKYVIRSIPTTGESTLTVELQGFQTKIRPNLQLHPNESYTINFQLEMATLEETVTVEATTPIVDVKEATVQQVITEDLLESVPIIGRNYIQLTHLAPGVTGSDYWPTTSGQHYWAMNYLVDGSSNFSKWRSAARTFYSGYSLETIKEMQIMGNQFSVEFGEGMSAINSAITKSGTNNFRGSVYTYIRPGDWDEEDLFTGTKAPYNQQQMGFSLGGPIIRDRTHFFVSYEYRRQRSNNTVIAPQYFGEIVPDKQDEHTVFAKVDHQLSSSDYITARYSNDIFDWRNEYGGYYLPGEGDTYVTYVHTVNAAWTKTTSADSVNELRFQFASYYDLRKALTQFPDRAAETRYNYYDIGGLAFYGDGFGVTPELTFEVFEKYTFGHKKHFFKIGGFVKYITANQIMNPYPNGWYYFLGAPDVFPDPYYFFQYMYVDPSLKEVRSKDLVFALFFEDEWNVTNRLTLNLGVRYDVEYIFDVAGYTSSPDWNNIQPRLGLAYDLFGNGKSVLRAGFGMFSQQHLSYHFTKGAFFGAEGQFSFTLFPGDPFFPNYPYGLDEFPEGALLPPRDIWEIDGSYKNPYSVQGTIGFQQEILPSLSLSVDAIYMTILDGKSVLDANAPASPTGPRSVAEADATRPLTPTFNGFRTIYHLGNESRSWYRALNIKLERRAADISFLLTYTLSKTTDMLNPWSLPQDSRDIEDDKGPGNVDRRHLVKLAFFVNSPFENIILRDWMFSGIGQIMSAAPYTETYGTDLWGTTLRNARPYGRNNLRGDPFYNLDLSLSRSIHVSTVEVELKFDVFNVFNIKNYTSFYGSRLAGDLFMEPYATAPPRRFQLGIHFRF